jgi:PilZ domain
MSGRERRGSTRKECVFPLRFRIASNGRNAEADEIAASFGLRGTKTMNQLATMEGEALNLSERGVYFTSRETLQVGEPLEMFFTLPRELTGRGPEQVRCTARVVHVDQETDQPGTRGFGATVERFEPIAAAPRNWAN